MKYWYVTFAHISNDISSALIISAWIVSLDARCQDANHINEDALQCCVWTVSAMKSTGPSTGPCSLWTAQSRPTQKWSSRLNSREAGKRKQRAGTQMSLIIPWHAIRVARRWPCMTKMRYTTSLMWWPVIHDHNKYWGQKNSSQFSKALLK